jgi:hypothetical protein
MRYELGDYEWKAIKPILPNNRAAFGVFGLRGQPRGASCDNFDFPVFESIDTSNYAEFPLFDRRVENRRRRFELRNIVDHILPNGGVEEIAGTRRSSVDCGSDTCNQGR